MGDGPVFSCRRGPRRPLRLVGPQEGGYCLPEEVPCPLGDRPPGCSWAGPAVELVEHLAGVHGRRYERG